jgi:hypothetical protein
VSKEANQHQGRDAILGKILQDVSKSNAPASPPSLPEKHNAVDDRQDKDYAHQATDLANIAPAALG